jgi:hypothetical protein
MVLVLESVCTESLSSHHGNAMECCTAVPESIKRYLAHQQQPPLRTLQQDRPLLRFLISKKTGTDLFRAFSYCKKMETGRFCSQFY